MGCMERRDAAGRRTRLERVKSRIADRLRPSCAALSEAEFDRLVEQIAEIEIKYDLRRTNDLFSGQMPNDV
jgi:hypothetical protein